MTFALKASRAANEHTRILVELLEPVFQDITRVQQEQANRAPQHTVLCSLLLCFVLFWEKPNLQSFF